MEAVPNPPSTTKGRAWCTRTVRIKARWPPWMPALPQSLRGKSCRTASVRRAWRWTRLPGVFSLLARAANACWSTTRIGNALQPASLWVEVRMYLPTMRTGIASMSRRSRYPGCDPAGKRRLVSSARCCVDPLRCAYLGYRSGHPQSVCRLCESAGCAEARGVHAEAPVSVSKKMALRSVEPSFPQGGAPSNYLRPITITLKLSGSAAGRGLGLAGLAWGAGPYSAATT